MGGIFVLNRLPSAGIGVVEEGLGEYLKGDLAPSKRNSRAGGKSLVRSWMGNPGGSPSERKGGGKKDLPFCLTVENLTTCKLFALEGGVYYEQKEMRNSTEKKRPT